MRRILTWKKEWDKIFLTIVRHSMFKAHLPLEERISWWETSNMFGLQTGILLVPSELIFRLEDHRSKWHTWCSFKAHGGNDAWDLSTGRFIRDDTCWQRMIEACLECKEFWESGLDPEICSLWDQIFEEGQPDIIEASSRDSCPREEDDEVVDNMHSAVGKASWENDDVEDD